MELMLFALGISSLAIVMFIIVYKLVSYIENDTNNVKKTNSDSISEPEVEHVSDYTSSYPKGYWWEGHLRRNAEGRPHEKTSYGLMPYENAHVDGKGRAWPFRG